MKMNYLQNIGKFALNRLKNEENIKAKKEIFQKEFENFERKKQNDEIIFETQEIEKVFH